MVHGTPLINRCIEQANISAAVSVAGAMGAPYHRQT